MNIICSGNMYQIYGDGIATYQSLPAQVYDVCFSKMTGFFLTSRGDMAVSEEKIYGDYNRKVNKVITAFKAVDRNLGVILSGPKGVGKSLFAKVLSIAAEKEGFPILVVSNYIPGIASFLASIDQDVIVLLDEFEKTFCQQDDHGPTPQDEMLTLFDGLEGGHKLYIVTCNNTHKLSEYLLNRPGRFHYHFALDVPNAEEITEYLIDKLAPSYHDMINSVIRFSRMGKITYDCLRAIAFELNMGYSLEETLNDLNLIRDSHSNLDAKIEMNDGSLYTAYNLHIDLYSVAEKNYTFWCNSLYKAQDLLGDVSVRFGFNLADVESDDEGFYVVADKISLIYDETDICDNETLKAKMKARIANGVKSFRLAPSASYQTKQKYLV